MCYLLRKQMQVEQVKSAPHNRETIKITFNSVEMIRSSSFKSDDLDKPARRTTLLKIWDNRPVAGSIRSELLTSSPELCISS